MRIAAVGGALLAGLLACMSARGGERVADLVLVNGRVVTMDAARPEAEALTVRDGRIVAVGDDADIRAWAGAETQRIDLQGRLALPGFIEGHGHFLSLGHSRMMLDLAGALSWEEVVDAVRRAARQAAPGAWIVGRGWHQGKWRRPPEPNIQGYPVHTALSRAAPRHPVLLTHGTGHMLVANAAAMQLAGVDRQTAEVRGGEILRTADGEPTGVFRENAMRLIRRVHARHRARRTPAERRADWERAVRLAADECLAHGVTSFQDAGMSVAEVDFLRGLADEGQLPVRLWVMLNDSNDVLAKNLARARTIDAGNGFLTVRAVKRMIDGALGTHGAWMLQPYDDLPTSIGHNTLSRASLRETAALCLKHDFQLCVHAIGDRANREVLDLLEDDFEFATRGNALRWRIEHAQHIDPSDIPRFARLGVIASMQGVHCTSDAPFVIARLGERRARTGAYVWRSLLDAGAVVTNGTDVPVERISPIASFYASVTRKLPGGVEFFPEQCMSRREALRSYTRDAAFAAFEEDRKGTLAAGKWADIVVLSRDLLHVDDDAILDTRVDYTLVGGKIVFRRE